MVLHPVVGFCVQCMIWVNDDCSQMMKEREDELTHIENEHKVEGVQDRFPNDDLQLQELSQKVRVFQLVITSQVWPR